MSDQNFLVLPGQLEIRKRGSFSSLRGSFPYSKTATVRDRGTVRKERIAGDAFGWQLQEFERVQKEIAATIQSATDDVLDELREEAQRRNVHVLSGHDFNKPWATCSAARLPSSQRARR